MLRLTLVAAGASGLATEFRQAAILESITGSQKALKVQVDQHVEEMRMDQAVAVLDKSHEEHQHVISLLQESSTGEADATNAKKIKKFKKAIKIMNKMIESAQAEVDVKMAECKAFHFSSEKRLKQMKNDLARFAGHVADSRGSIDEAVNGIEKVDADGGVLDDQLTKAEAAYTKQKEADDIALTQIKNAVAVQEIVMEVTKCKKKKMMLVEGHLQSCAAAGEDDSVEFLNTDIQDKMEQLAESDKAALQHALGKSVNDEPVSLFQLRKVSRTRAPGGPPQVRRKCSLKKPKCGLLHDNMSLLWGESKDKHDILVDQMTRNENEWNTLQDDINAQIKALADEKAKLQAEQAKAQSELSTAEALQGQKEAEEKTERATAKAHWKKCISEIDILVFSRSCGCRKVRGQLRAQAVKLDKKFPELTDCVVSDFVEGPCNSKCDKEMKGGQGTLVRTIEQDTAGLGLKCPELEFQTKCNQIKCPIECKMTNWSGFGQCSADCGGGIETRTRNVIHEPKNGGKPCSGLSEMRGCHVESCDRDCRLHWWGKWGHCSQACDGGRKEKYRAIRTPTRGAGKCPRRTSKERRRIRGCNRKKCNGDEICIAKQDLVIALDGSGSVSPMGWAIMKNFTGELLKRYKTKAYHSKMMRIGLVTFGNGEVKKNKQGESIVSAAKVESHLTKDLKGLRKKVKALKQHNGFTNLAQAFTKAKEIFEDMKGRMNAQSTVIVITDGKPSFEYNTEKAANALKDTGVHLNIMTIRRGGPGTDEAKFMKKLVSAPARSHFVHVNGFNSLSAQWKDQVTNLIVNTCPWSESPKRMCERSARAGFRLIRWNQDCPNWWLWLGRHYSPRGCAARARKKGVKYFVYGRGWWFFRGICYSDKVHGKTNKCTYKPTWWNKWVGWWRSRFDNYRVNSPKCKLGSYKAVYSLAQVSADDSDSDDVSDEFDVDESVKDEEGFTLADKDHENDELTDENIKAWGGMRPTLEEAKAQNLIEFTDGDSDDGTYDVDDL